MGIRLDRHRVAAPLEAMTGLAVTPVEMSRVAGIQPLHASREIRVRRPHQQVVVRRSTFVEWRALLVFRLPARRTTSRLEASLVSGRRGARLSARLS
jgi:hypothetical protein